jgi:hypothetical protein
MKYRLNIEIPFTDRITKEDYIVGDVKEFEKDRGEELLADKRKLVSLNEIIEDKPKADTKNETIEDKSKADTKKAKSENTPTE